MDSTPDRRVASAPAEIPGDPLFDLLRRRVGMLGEQAHNRHQEPWRAEAALQALALVKRLLNGVQRSARRRQSLDCRYLVALGLDCQYQARPHRLAVQQDRAAPTHAVLATHVGPGQAEIVTEVVRKQTPRIERRRVQAPIDLHAAKTLSVRTRTR